MGRTTLAFLKALSQVLGNLSATWFAVAFITPNFSNLSSTETLIVLTKDVSFGIVFLLATTLIERQL